MLMKKLLLLFVAVMTAFNVAAKTSDENYPNLIGSFEPADGNYSGVVTGAPKVVRLTLVNKGTETVPAHEIDLYVENNDDEDDFFYVGSGSYNCPDMAPGDSLTQEYTITFSKAGTFYLSAYDNLKEDYYQSDYFSVTDPAQKDYADTTVTVKPADDVWGSVVNQDKQMVVTIKNSGQGYDINSFYFVVGWDCNEDYNTYGFSPWLYPKTLKPGESATYTFTFRPTKAGTYYFYVSDEDETWDVAAIQSFKVFANDKELQDAINAGELNGPSQGDTYDTDGYVTPTNETYGDIKVGSPKEFSVVVFNNGTTKIDSHPAYPEIICSDDYDDYETLPTITVPAIDPGDSAIVNFTYTPKKADSFYFDVYDNLAKKHYQSYTFAVADTFDVIVADTTITLVPEDGFVGAVNGQDKSFILTVKNSGIHKLIKTFKVSVGIGMLDDDDAYAYAPTFSTGKIEAGDSVTKRITFTPTWGAGDAEIWIYVQKNSGSYSTTVYNPFKIYATQEEYDSAVAAGVKGVKVDKANADTWYTVSGARLAGKPTQPGLYINGNKKVVVK